MENHNDNDNDNDNNNNNNKNNFSIKLNFFFKNSTKIKEIFNKIDKIKEKENKIQDIDKDYKNNINNNYKYIKDKELVYPNLNKTNKEINENINNKIFNIKIPDFFFKATFTGIIIGAFALIIEHPLESIKVQWQADIKFKNSKEIIKNIYSEKGIIGFYRGLIPNLIRRSCKNFYRWPLMLYLPNIFHKINNNIFPNLNSEGLNKIQTGLFLANFETFFISPIERLKVYFMTYTPSARITYNKFDSLFLMFYLNNKGRIIKELFIGLDASLYRSNISWISFLYLEYEGKRLLLDLKCTNELSFFDLLIVSVFVMIGNLGLSKYFIFYFLYLFKLYFLFIYII
jgi:hypothetical protein